MVIFLCMYGYAQENLTNKKSDNEKSQEISSDSIFSSVRQGILERNVETFSKYLSSQTFLNLANATSGYYSSNQAIFVLQDFINNYEASSFNFNELNQDEQNPYATGVLQFLNRGKEDSANVFISLKKTGSGWNIKQITIN
jgi:Domain of unknown function (DUF4783)